MTRCDCSTLSTCEVCCPPRTESELQEKIYDLTSAYESYRDRPTKEQAPDTAEDYARHFRIGVDPATGNDESETAVIVCGVDEDGNATEIYSALCLQIVHGRAYAFLTGKQDHSTGIFGGGGGRAHALLTGTHDKF